MNEAREHADMAQANVKAGKAGGARDDAAQPGRVERVVLVGHCGADSGALHHAVRQALGEAVTVTSAHDAAGLEQAGRGSLLLINRVLEYGFGSGSGIDLIRTLAAGANPPRMMLISNYAESQAQAVAAGALPGFGKSSMRTEETARMLRDAAGAARAS